MNNNQEIEMGQIIKNVNTKMRIIIKMRISNIKTVNLIKVTQKMEINMAKIADMKSLEADLQIMLAIQIIKHLIVKEVDVMKNNIVTHVVKQEFVHGQDQKVAETSIIAGEMIATIIHLFK